MPLSSAIDRFLSLNRKLARAIERRLPADFTRHLHTLYKYRAAEMINAETGQVVLDVGAGRDCPFLPFVSAAGSHLIIGVDFSEQQLRRNPVLRVRLVADASAHPLPLRSGTIDIVASRSVVEHLPDNSAFFANCAAVLRPGGMLIHTFPCKFTPFALLNRLLPNRLTRRLIARLHPAWRDACGFPAFYDRCCYSQVRELLSRNGFHDPQFAFRYYQGIYFDFFFPLYFIALLYDLIIWKLDIRNLACGMLVVARKEAERASVATSTFGDPRENPLERASFIRIQ